MDNAKKTSAGFYFSNKQSRLAIIAIALIAIGIVLFAARSCRQAGVETSKNPLFTVERGPLTISITENGTIQNREKVVIESEVEGRNTIVFLEEEGKMVEEGDLLVKLDSSSLEDSQLDQEIGVQNADASLIQARENLAIAKNQAKADIEQAELDLKFARLDLKKYDEGEYPMELQQSKSAITLAEEELKNSEDQYDWSKRLAEKGYITGVELKGDELAVERKQIDLQTAREELKLLEKYTHGKKLEELNSAVSQAEMALERIERKAKADVVNAEADLRAKESQYQREKNKLDRINEQIEKCTITAPNDGMVVYAQTGGRRRHRNEEPLDVGQDVSERQELIYLPKTSRMDAQIQIQESSLTKLKEGLPAKVEIDALEGEVVAGTLTKIAILPDATRSWLNPDLKVYNCVIQLENTDADLRPGMSCRATIIIREYSDALYVPVQSVVKVDGRPTVYVEEGAEIKPQPVEIGMDNNRMVHVLSGLSEGQQVSLTPPLDKSVKHSTPVGKRAEKAGTGKEAREANRSPSESGGKRSSTKGSSKQQTDRKQDESTR